jgi:hypothetical protein
MILKKFNVNQRSLQKPGCFGGFLKFFNFIESGYRRLAIAVLLICFFCGGSVSSVTQPFFTTADLSQH